MSETSAPSSLGKQPTPTVVEMVAAGAFPPTTVRRPSRRKGKIPRLRKWQPIIITWTDAFTEYEKWASEVDVKCLTRHTIGHFIKRTKEAITLAMEDDRECKEQMEGENDCEVVTSIPCGMIQRVTILIPQP